MTHAEINGTPVGQDPLVSWFMKGVFNCQPHMPRPTHLGRALGSQVFEGASREC